MMKWIKNVFRNSCFSNPKYNGFAVVRPDESLYEYKGQDLTELDKLALKAAEEKFTKNPSSLEKVINDISNELL